MTIKSIATLFFCFACLGSLWAVDGDPILIKSTVDGTEIGLHLANLQGQQTTVTLTSLDTDENIWTNSIKAHNGFSYQVDLEGLDFGRYCLQVKKGDLIKKQVVLVNERGVALSTIK